jgi:nitrous oxide reductase accessory protein NosL
VNALLPDHRDYLLRHAISDGMIDACGVYSNGDRLVFPWRDGDTVTEQYKEHPEQKGPYIWVKGEPKVRLYSSIEATFAALGQLEREGKQVRVSFVHDRETGNKLFADKVWYVQSKSGLSAFLLRSSADAWAKKHDGGQLVGFDAARKAPGQASL